VNYISEVANFAKPLIDVMSSSRYDTQVNWASLELTLLYLRQAKVQLY